MPRTNSSTKVVKPTRRPGGCWLPSPSTPSETKTQRKTVGDVDKAAPQPEPGMRKVPDGVTKKLLGKLERDVSLYEGVTEKPIKSPKSLNKLAAQIGADPENEGSTSVSVGSFKAVTVKRAIEMLCKADSPRLNNFDRESDDNNFRYYKPEEAKQIVDHLLTQAGRGGKLYVSDWDDISSEWVGIVLAAVKPDNRSVTFAQVVGFRP